MSNLSYLNLGFNEMSSEGLIAVMKSIASTRVRSLSLSGNTMTPAVVSELSVFLSTNSVLTELYLDHMNIGHAGEKRIAATIVSNKSIALITFSGFRLGPGNFLLIYICNFHVLSHLRLIYICKLHWNLFYVCEVVAKLENLLFATDFFCEANNFETLQQLSAIARGVLSPTARPGATPPPACRCPIKTPPFACAGNFDIFSFISIFIK